jgi:hypothetical protein
MGATPGIRAIGGHRSSRVSASRGDERHTALLGPVHGVMGAPGPISQPSGQRQRRSTQVQEGFEPAAKPHQLRRQRGSLGLSRTTPRPPRATSGGGGGRRLRCRIRLAGRVRRSAAHARLNTDGARTSFLEADQREGEDGQPGPPWLYRLATPRSRPSVCFPAVVTTTSSPASRYTSPGR